MANAETATEVQYKTSVEDAGPARKRLTITAPADVITEKIQQSLGTLSLEAHLPGFRKGRAPKALIERRFGTNVREETRNQVMSEGYQAAVEEHELKPIGQPVAVEKIEDLELREGEAFSFSIDIEVMPDFELPNLEGVPVKKPTMEMGDEQIGIELQRQCSQAGEVIAVEDEPAAAGDRLVGPGTATLEGADEPFFTHEAIDVVIPDDEAEDGRGHLLGLLVEGLRKQLVGKKVGDQVRVETVGPESHELEEIRGKNLAIEFTVEQIQRLIPAEVNQVVAMYGFESEEMLREQIKLALEQRRDNEQRAAMREQVSEWLAEQLDFELPERLSQQQAERNLERIRMDLMHRGGLSPDEVEEKLAEVRSETEAAAQRRLKLFFIMHRLAEHFEVQVSEEEVNGRIASIAAQRNMRPDQVRKELAQSNQIYEVAHQIREQKAADRVIDKAEITEISAEEWNAMVEEKRAASKKTIKTKKKSGTKKKTSKKSEAGGS